MLSLYISFISGVKVKSFKEKRKDKIDLGKDKDLFRKGQDEAGQII